MPNMYKRTCEIMTANADKNMSDVAQIISQETEMPINQARAYYIRAVKLGDAPGTIVLEKRGRKPKATIDSSEVSANPESVNTDQLNDIMADVLHDIQAEKIRDAA